MTIRLRLTLWYTGILALTLLLFGSALYLYIRESNTHSQKAQLDQISQVVVAQMAVRGYINPLTGEVSVSAKLPPLDEYRYSNFFIQFINPNDMVQAYSFVPFPYPHGIVELMEKQKDTPLFQTYSEGGHTLLILNRAIVSVISGASTYFGVLQVAAVQDSMNELLDRLLSVLILLTVIVIVIGATLGLFLARQALRPIERVIAATEQIERGQDLANRIEYFGPPDEIGRLTNKINSMLERIQGAYTELEEAYGKQRRFVSDASHELRTPLTTIRGNVDLLEKVWSRQESAGETALVDTQTIEMSLEAMQDIAGEASRMSRLVNDLLSLARADAGLVMTKEPVLLAPIVEQVVRRASLLPKAVDWQVGDLSALEGVEVDGNADYLQQLLFIFIENAFKYTDRGHVRIETALDGNQIGIIISDTGIGMDKEEVPFIFERFYRADESRGKKAGTGLGLSIAKWIIDEHGGSIEVKTRKDEGTTFVIWLPARFHPLND